MDKFEKAIIGNYSNYQDNSSFQSIVFGHSTPLLETELNELQQIQEEARTQLIRAQVYSGFSELVQQDFLGEKYIFKPTVANANNSVEMTNCLAIAPFTAYINGYKIDGKGNFLYKGNEYILIDIGETTEETIEDTLVYLEAWFEYAKGDYIPKKNGYVLGDDISDKVHKRIIMDERVNQETSRRKILCWNICVKKECDFDTYPNGLGYKNQNKYSHVFAKANGQYGLEDNVNLAFKEATRDDFKGENFNYDKNLYVAGSKNYNTQNKSLAERYIFALPMFRIRRRNKLPYSIENYNGSYSVTYNFKSRDNGDITLRPDKKCYDIVYDDDIMDIRQSINFADYNNETLGDEVIKDLFNGKLITKQKVRMRRVQFGNEHLKYNFSDVDSVYPEVPQKALIIPFDKSYAPVFPVGEVLIDKGIVEYEDSIHGYGAKILKGENLRYKISSTGINVKEGTFDFWIKPFFNGTDKENITIFELTNIGNNPILTLKKVNTEFILTQYNYAEDDETNETVKSEAIMDLSNDLLLSDRYYFIRVSWTHNPMPTNSQMYLYINGELKAQTDISECYLDPYYLYFGSKNNTKEFLIEEFIAYITNFEILSSAGTYGFAKNNFWPFLPQDFRDTEDVLMLPNFNSIVNNYSDDSFVQEETVFHLYAQTVNTQNMFYIKLTNDKIVRSIENIYALDGSHVTTNVINLGTNNVSIQVYDQTVKQIIVVATLELSKGCGGVDVPTEILQACIMKYEDESDNYKYNLNVYKEVSFADYNSEEPRQVSLYAPERPDGNIDSAYDISNHYRKRNQCYARLIHYNITKSTSMSGSNQFDIPIYVYGYKVVGVIGSSVNQISKVIKVPSLVAGEDDEKFTVYMKNPVEVGATITFYLATEGFSFDYELNSKSLMVNMCQCRVLHFEADGTNSTFTVPCINIEDDGIIHGGILKSVFTLSNNVLDNDGNVIYENGERKTVETVMCYHDGMVYYDEEGNPTDERKFNTQRITVNTESFGTPFITVNFDSENKPRKGTIIQIPIVVSYQMPENILMSIWYNYLPYQGMLDKNEVTVKRLTDWKYFITTLGTGKTDEEEISCNIVNNLPGGFAEGYRVNNQPITLKNMFNNMSYTLNNYHLNQKIVFMKDYMLGAVSPFYNLVNTIKINKNGRIAQDGLISFDEEMIMYFSDCVEAINKYIGAYCTVITDTGEIMVLVVGNINFNETIVNVLCPIYGDLYRITGRPTSKR